MISFKFTIVALAFIFTFFSMALTSPIASDSNVVHLKSTFFSRADAADVTTLKSEICVDVCDHTGCYEHSAPVGTCSEATKDLSQPITWINVPKGYYCYVFSSLECGQAKEEIIGGEAQHKLQRDYHTYSCWKGLGV
jgi:hypothetical protein